MAVAGRTSWSDCLRPASIADKSSVVHESEQVIYHDRTIHTHGSNHQQTHERMAQVIILEGASGSGKTTSLRNMDPSSSLYITTNKKPLPWKGGDALWGKRKQVVDKLDDISAMLMKANKVPAIKYVFIDDHTHFQNKTLLSDKFYNEGFNNSTKWGRWEAFGRSVYSSVFGMHEELRDDMIIVVMAHVMDGNDGEKVFKTFGKMTGNTVDPVSYANIVLHSLVLPDKKKSEERYVFLTNRDGLHEAKSPYGMFDEDIIPNDMALVVKAIEEFEQPEPAPVKEEAEKTTKNQK